MKLIRKTTLLAVVLTLCAVAAILTSAPAAAQTVGPCYRDGPYWYFNVQGEHNSRGHFASQAECETERQRVIRSLSTATPTATVDSEADTEADTEADYHADCDCHSDTDYQADCQADCHSDTDYQADYQADCHSDTDYH